MEFIDKLEKFATAQETARTWDDRKLLWMVLRFLIPPQDEPFSQKSAIQSELEDRLYPEYDAETVVRTETGWSTPEGNIDYV